MSTYQDASNLKSQLTALINKAIENHPLVKSAIKTKKATVDSVNTTAKTVTVRFPFDTTLVTLPYNPQMENYLTSGIGNGKVVSVWYYQDINNGIVMQDGGWNIDNATFDSNGKNIANQFADKMPQAAVSTTQSISQLTNGFYSKGSPSYEKIIVVGSDGDRLMIYWDYAENALKFTVTNNGNVLINGATIYSTHNRP